MDPAASIPPREVLLFARDLLFETRIRSTAQAVGVTLRSVHVESGVIPLLAEPAVTGLIVDLDCGDAAIRVIEAARRERPSVLVIAFGPHMQASLLEQAGTAGADTVLPRSRFVQQLPELLRTLASATS